MSLDAVYREQIMDHYKNPRNQGRLENFNLEVSDQNPSCGDEIKITAVVQDSKLTDVKFTGIGCAISQAAASMLFELVKGKPIKEIIALTREDIIDILGISVGPVRVKCAVLALVALKNGIEKFEEYERRKGK